MPLHFEDLDIGPEVEGLGSLLVVPCYMCPAVTVAVREDRPFLRLFRSFLTSIPFEGYLRGLRSRLAEQGVASEVFESRLYHHWFLCTWGSGRRGKLRRKAESHDGVLVLGCESATETVRDALGSMDCKVIEGMEATGIMNAKIEFHWTGRVSFSDCRITPLVKERPGFETAGRGEGAGRADSRILGTGVGSKVTDGPVENCR